MYRDNASPYCNLQAKKKKETSLSTPKLSHDLIYSPNFFETSQFGPFNFQLYSIWTTRSIFAIKTSKKTKLLFNFLFIKKKLEKMEKENFEKKGHKGPNSASPCDLLLFFLYINNICFKILI